MPLSENITFVQWFRNAAPYINAFRGRTFVITFSGEAVADTQFPHLIHDIALLNSLGVRLVLVHGARPQIEQRLTERQAVTQVIDGIRITDAAALGCVKEAVGALRVEIESLLSMGLANSPMAGARLRVTCGNFVTARPVGIRNGIDYQHTGEVRRIDGDGIRQPLDNGAIVLLSPLGYSPTGETFNLLAEDVATATASALGADKLLYLVENLDTANGLPRELTLSQARELLDSHAALAEDQRLALRGAVQVCGQNVHRAHLIPRQVEGALLQELFTRDGIGTLISADLFEGTRPATIDDVGGILELIAPLEQAGILVRRSRERLETEIGRFVVVERDGMIIACAALYPFTE
ncbi:MAG: amino-acid N-acetyltransferase, partial [Gammaproteobacteria bacterium RBG_16_57_12]